MSIQFSRLQECWSWIDAQRGDISSALTRLAMNMPSDDRAILSQLARWFAGKAGFEKAITHPDILAVCVPLIEIKGPTASPSEIERAVRIGFCSIARTRSTKGRVLNLILYPALLFLAMFALAIFFSLFIIPYFESIFVDFGIELPKMTMILFKLAWLVRASWIFVLGFMVAALVFVYLANVFTRDRRSVGESWLDERCKSTRTTAAGWAWHMAMLLESGFSVPKAVEVADYSQNKNWLKRASRKLVGDQQSLSEEVNDSLFGDRHRLLETTLEVNNPVAQVSLFKEIATYYWTCNRTIGEWWMQWSVSALFWLFAVAIVLVVFFLYMPLLAIVSGLTGGTVSGLSGGMF